MQTLTVLTSYVGLRQTEDRTLQKMVIDCDWFLLGL